MSTPVEELNDALAALIPSAHAMGVRFVELRPGFASASVPFAGNGNHFGVIYAGVSFTVAEVLGGGLHYATFDPATHYPVVRRLEIDFVAPGTSDLVASATLAPEEIARIAAELTPSAKVAFTLHADVVGTDGTVVARTRGEYQIRPFGR